MGGEGLVSLELENITFSYPGAGPIIENFSLSIAPGERVALMAPSGRGKSTLLGIAGLLLRQDSGTVRIAGEEIRPGASAHELLGETVMWILQTTSLLPRRTLLDNVLLPLAIRGADREASIGRAIRALSAVNLRMDMRRKARTLSGGEAQRVGVARAIVAQPKLVLADEPTANLDRANSELVAEVLCNTLGDSSLLVATHDATITQYVDRVIEL